MTASNSRTRDLVALAYLLLAVAPASLAGLLVVVAVTWRGTFFSLVSLGLLALPLVWLSRRSTRVKLVSTIVELTLIFALGVSAPRVPEFDGVQPVSQINGGSRVSLFAWLPEVDQMVLGSYPMMLLDGALDEAHAARLRTLLKRAYGPFTLMGSNLGDVATPSSGQLYVILPQPMPAGRRPLLVFLHGSGGNFVAYQNLLQRWANAAGFVVVSPGFGFGDWHHAGGLEAVERARTWAVKNLPVDASKVGLVVLSNGGRAATRLIAADTTNQWPVVVALSAVLEPRILNENWSGKQVLVIHGADDERIGIDFLKAGTSEIERLGARVELTLWPAEDHFLWFSKPHEVQERALHWLALRLN